MDAEGSIIAHTESYSVAEKYQVKKLQIAACDMSSCHLTTSKMGPGQWSCLRIIFTRLPENDGPAPLNAIRYCALNLVALREEDGFMALLVELPGPGTAVLPSKHLRVGSKTEKLYRCPNGGIVCDLHSCIDFNDRVHGDCECEETQPTCRYCAEEVDDREDRVFTFVQLGT